MIMYLTWPCAYYLIILIPIITIAITLLVRKYIWQQRIIHTLGKKFLLNVSHARKTIQLILIISALIFLALALARPQAESQEHFVKQEGRDILIALDISRSMLAQDIKPSRLEAAKEKIKKLVTQLDSDRVGLIVFSGSAFLYVPFTEDIDTFLQFLQEVTVEQFSSSTTALDKALEKAIEVFSAGPTRKNKLLVLFTDGEDFSHNLNEISHKARDIGMQIFTVGVGTAQGAPVPVVDQEGKIQDYQRDKNNNIVISRLNETLLQQLAGTLSAFYSKASESEEDIYLLINTIKKLEKEKFNDKSISLLQERYYYFASISLLLLFIEWIL